VVREDPRNRDLLFVGSSLSVYASIDRGQTWSKLASGMPSVPVYDLKIHPRDRELMAATHGRGLWFVDVSALEQMTQKSLADAATLYQPRTAFQWGEGPTLGLPGNGYGQAPLVIAPPAYGASISYRLRDSATTPVRVTVSDASGTQLFQTTGPGRAGVHTVNWAFQGAPAARAALTPSGRRDSILMRVRAPQVIDSLTKAGYDTGAIAAVRRIVNVANNPQLQQGLAGRFGGGGGGRGGNVGCDHPPTQWDTFCARPAEPPPAAARGGRGGRGAAAADAAAADTSAEALAAAFGGGGGGGRGGDPAQNKIWELIGMKAPQGGRGGGGGFGGGGNLAEGGTYVATLTVNGSTYKQSFRVEKSGMGDDVGFSQITDDQDDNDDINGGILPKFEKPLIDLIKKKQKQ
jgi:hypothetical protein